MKTLREVYESHKTNLETLYKKLQEEGLWDECSYPLLMSEWEGEELPEAMLFGQETNGWGKHDSIEGLMEDYRDFNLGEYYNSLFWRYLWEMSINLGLKGRHPFLWNNINKFGKADSVGRPNPRVTELENKYFNVLKEELQVIKPKICIFFTGPNYDSDLRAKLPDLEVLPVDGYPINEVAKLRSQYLPEHSYRTYHPGYGNRYRDWYKEVLFNTISNKCKEIVDSYIDHQPDAIKLRFYKKELANKLKKLALAVIEFNESPELKKIPFSKPLKINYKYSVTSSHTINGITYTSPDKKGEALLEEFGKEIQKLSNNFRKYSEGVEITATGDENKYELFEGSELQGISEEDLNFLRTHPDITLEIIKNISIDELYGKVFTTGDLLIIKQQAGIENEEETLIECINCDAGVISQLENIGEVVYNKEGMTDFETSLLSMSQEKDTHPISKKKILFFQTNSKKFQNWHRRIPKHVEINWDTIIKAIKNLNQDEILMVFSSRQTLYQDPIPNFKEEVVKSEKLKAVINIEGRENNASKGKNCVLVFSGIKQKEVEMIDVHDFQKPHNEGSRNEYFTEKAKKLKSNLNKIESIKIPLKKLILSSYILAPIFYKNGIGYNTIKLKDIGNIIVSPSSIDEGIKPSYDNYLVFESSNLVSYPPVDAAKTESFNNFNQLSPKTDILFIEERNVIIIAKKNDVILSAFLENTKNSRLFIDLKWENYCVLELKEDIPFIPQFIAQIFHSNMGGVKEQLLTRDNTIKNKNFIENIYLPVLDFNEQNKFILENINKYYKIELEKISEERDDYKKIIRSRKHSLGNELYGMKGTWDRLKQYIIDHDGETIDLEEEIGRRFKTTGQKMLETLSSDFSRITELIEYMAESDNNYGDPLKLNLKSEVLTKLEHLNFEDVEIIFESQFSDFGNDDKGYIIYFPYKGLNMILTNIFSNIQNHGFIEGYQKNKRISIKFFNEGDNLVLQIGNNGAPLPENIDFFDRYDKTRRKMSNGHISEGLGLHDSREVMRKNKGNLSLFSKFESEFETIYELRFKKDNNEK